MNKSPVQGQKRQDRAETIMGEAGFAEQTRRANDARRKAIMSGGNVDKANTVETVKRVGEYRKRDYKPPNHGKRRK